MDARVGGGMGRWMDGWIGFSGAGRGKKAWGVWDGAVAVVYWGYIQWSRA